MSECEPLNVLLTMAFQLASMISPRIRGLSSRCTPVRRWENIERNVVYPVGMLEPASPSGALPTPSKRARCYLSYLFMGGGACNRCERSGTVFERHPMDSVPRRLGQVAMMIALDHRDSFNPRSTHRDYYGDG